MGGIIILICPKCKSEYQEGYTVCSDCQCELVKVPDDKEDPFLKNGSKLVQLIIGGFIIFLSPILSFKLTKLYFIPNGSESYDNSQFIAMFHAYHYSILLLGALICLPCILFWFKNFKIKQDDALS
jgi:hypothetical protein